MQLWSKEPRLHPEMAEDLVAASTGHWFSRCERCRVAKAIETCTIVPESQLSQDRACKETLRAHCVKVKPKL